MAPRCGRRLRCRPSPGSLPAGCRVRAGIGSRGRWQTRPGRRRRRAPKLAAGLRSTSDGRSWRRPGRDAAPRAPAGRAGADARRSSPPSPAWSTSVAGAGGDRRGCGVGLRRADDRGRRGGVAAEHPGLAGLPAPGRGWPSATGLADLRRQRRQGPGPGRGLARGGRRRAPTSSPWSCPPGSAAASCSTAGCSTARRQRRPHRPRHRRARGPALRLRGPGLPGGGGVGHRRSPPVTGRPAAEAGPEVVEPAPAASSAGPWPSVANLLDLRLAVVAGSVALGFGDPFFAAAQAELDRPARLRSPGVPASSRPASAPPARSSAPPPWAGGAWAACAGPAGRPARTGDGRARRERRRRVTVGRRGVGRARLRAVAGRPRLWPVAAGRWRGRLAAPGLVAAVAAPAPARSRLPALPPPDDVRRRRRPGRPTCRPTSVTPPGMVPGGRRRRPGGGDVVAYLEWCRRFGRR